MTTEKDLTKTVRDLVRDELKNHTGARFIRGVDTKYVGDHRQVRPSENPKPLLFTGNPYVIITFARAFAELEDGTENPISTAQLRKVWEKVKNQHFPDGRINVEGTTHVLLDPTLTEDNRIQFGFTGLKLPALPVPPQFKSVA